MTPQLSSHWHEPSVVDEFVRREPDHRLVALLDEEQDPSRLRVLDLGCAGGRNTVVLAARGCDTYAVDLSPEMIEATRSRIAPILGEAEANARVVLAPMDDLSMFPAALFDLVVALGIHHQASTVAEWSRAVDETVRVLRSGGRFLVAHFAPGTDLSGEHGQPIEGSPDRYELRDGRAAVLYDAEALDARMRERGLTPIVPTTTVERLRDEGGKRVTVNALYRKT
jgi:SAM-dependent methyltransferase